MAADEILRKCNAFIINSFGGKDWTLLFCKDKINPTENTEVSMIPVHSWALSNGWNTVVLYYLFSKIISLFFLFHVSILTLFPHTFANNSNLILLPAISNSQFSSYWIGSFPTHNSSAFSIFSLLDLMVGIL